MIINYKYSNEIVEKKHWYDGWLYSRLIDTQHIAFRNKILDLIGEKDSVLDIGCGTGGFTLEVGKKCKSVTGIDISAKQIRHAIIKSSQNNLENVEFLQANALDLQEFINNKYDIALFNFILHELRHKIRLDILDRISQISKSLIILEYNVPHPYNIFGLSTRLIEFFAGKEHFTNFLDFKRRNGINQILNEVGLQVNKEYVNKKKIFKIVVTKT